MKVMNLGSFDIVHYGHLALLSFCKELAGGDEVVVGLNSDEFVEKFKGHKPIMSYQEREKTLLALPWVDEVVKNLQPEESATKVMLNANVRLVVSGMDWYKKDLMKQWDTSIDWLDKHGISVCFFPFYNTQKISSSIIKERVRLAS